MSFNFGNTSQPGLLGATSTPAKPTSGFGSFSFGATATAAPAFGATTTTSSAPAFGTAPTFGTGTAFGAQASAVPNFSFGSNTAAPAAQPSLGFGGFGTAATSAAPAFGALGTSTSTGFSGFGSAPAPAFGGFGTGTSTTSAAPLFGGFGTTSAPANTGFSGFGTSFGSTFGKPASTAAPAFGGFGTTFGQQQQQQLQPFQQQQQQLNPDEAFAQSIFNVSIYGDERDTVIAKWNYLQAMWGTGEAFYSQSAPPVKIEPQNYLCRFKTMGYCRLPGKEDKVGLVSLVINKPQAEVENQKQLLLNNLGQLFGNKPNLIINFDSFKTLPDKKTQVVIYIEEKSQQAPNETKRILATEVSNFLNQVNLKNNLNSMGVESILAMVLPDEDKLKEYLEKPPKGIDPRMWRQAKIDNPDPTKFIPVPMVGFKDLKARIDCQQKETDAHVQYLAKVEKDLTELKQRHSATTAKIMEHKRKLAELSHKILKIIVKQESTRKVGVVLSPEEEILRSKLENMQALVSAPTQFKGRLSELLSQMRMQRNQWTMTAANEYTLDKDSSEEMKAFLTMQQKAMEFLIEIVNKDTKAIKIISDGMSQLTRS